MSDAVNWAVLFLMAMPYVVATLFALSLFYAYRRHLAKDRERRKKKARAAGLALVSKGK